MGGEFRTPRINAGLVTNDSGEQQHIYPFALLEHISRGRVPVGINSGSSVKRAGVWELYADKHENEM